MEKKDEKSLKKIMNRFNSKNYWIDQNYNKILERDWLSAARFEH